jgi:hypothetical protein
MANPQDRFTAAMQKRTFANIAEAQAFLDDITRRRNQTPLDDFQGLSPEQMMRFLYHPFDSPDLITYPPFPTASSAAPVMVLFGMLTDAIGEKGVKQTQRGNLPLKIVRDIALAYWGEERYQHNSRFGAIRTEPDFADLHVTRIIAGLAGMLRKYKGMFVLTQACRALLAKHGLPGVYPRMLQACASKYNWGYQDLYPELPLIQHSFLFTLYLLHRFGDKCRLNSFYEDALLRAFPNIVNEVERATYGTPERIVRDCYSMRCLDRFVSFMGLAEITQKSNDILNRKFETRKTPLLDEAVEFTL